MKNFSIKIDLCCPVCGNAKIEEIKNKKGSKETKYICLKCNKEFTLNQLIEKNQKKIKSAIKTDVKKDLDEGFLKMFK